MKQYDHPAPEEFQLAGILHALADPFRLSVVQKLMQKQPQACAPLQDGRPKSSISHHFAVLRKSGLLRTEVVGVTHMNSLRLQDMEARFPGLLVAILAAAEQEEMSAPQPA